MAVHRHRDNLHTRPGHGNTYQVQLVVPERNLMSNERTMQYPLISVFVDEQVRTARKRQPSCFALTDNYTRERTTVEYVCTAYFGCFLAGESNTGGHTDIIWVC